MKCDIVLKLERGNLYYSIKKAYVKDFDQRYSRCMLQKQCTKGPGMANQSYLYIWKEREFGICKMGPRDSYKSRYLHINVEITEKKMNN